MISIATWPILDEAAYHGIVGDIVRTISPHTEADPAAILMPGVDTGRQCHWSVALLPG